MVSLMLLGGCDLSQNYLKADREASLETQDYRDAMASRLGETQEDDWGSDAANGRAGGVPELQPYIAQPGGRMKSMPLVSVSVNQTVPLRDVLYELAEQADYDIELDPNIRGAVIFSARNRPFDEVVERIASIANLRYKFKDDVLRVEVDTPYNKLYKIDYLSYLRSSTSQIGANISVTSGGNVDTGSNFQTTAETNIDFWGELEANLEQILGWARSNSLTTRRSPQIQATAANPNVEVVAPTGEDGTPANYAAPEAVVNISSLPTDEEDLGQNGGSAEDGNGFSFSMNKQAGLINVYANERAHKEIHEYLTAIKKSVASQVLIEAKILEVQLNDESATGIDWSSLQRFSDKLIAAKAVPGVPLGLIDENTAITRAASTVFSGDTNFFLSYAGDVEVLIQALSGFGTVKALASPRITVLNNQPAMLNVSTNQVYFEVDIDVSTTDAGTQTDISSTSNSVPEGVIVNVQPSINLENSTISMAVRPTVTSVSDNVPDPAVQYVTAANNIEGVVSTVPELNVQEIDSVIKMRSGQPVVMGGLLQDRVTSVREGLPILQEIPIAGALFRDQNDLIKKTELVIFLKATILDTPEDSVHSTDKDLYRKFSSDRRPLRF
ncbi:MAG: type II and III secretion system family protein [Micavibrio sp.]|nr:type II and III secretion system family protein [Micavibrio sp.]